MYQEQRAQFVALNVERRDFLLKLKEKDEIIDQLKLEQVTNSHELTEVKKQSEET